MEEHSVEEDANDINTTLLELQEAFAAALSNAGILGKLRAQLRAAAIGIIRADPHLHEAALGRTMEPSSFSPAGRVALLLIEDFLKTHGMQYTTGVFDAESGVGRIGDDERTALKSLQGPRALEASNPTSPSSSSSSYAPSLLEGLIQTTMGDALSAWGSKEKPPANATPHPDMIKPTTPPPQRSKREEPKEGMIEKMMWPSHPEIAAAMDAYEESVEFSDESDHGREMDQRQYEHIETY